MEHRETIRSLFKKYLSGDYTAEELDIMLAYFHVDAREPYLKQLIQHELDTPLDTSAYAEAIDEVDAGARAYLAANIRQASTPSFVKRYRLAIAASILALMAVGIGGYFAVESQKSSGLPTGQAGDRLAATDILPGGNRATLTLADGRVVNLDEAQTGIVVGAEDITYDDGTALEAVILSGEGEVSRGGVEGSLPNSGDTPAILALTTPKGGTYQITLPDGSRVWLNSASTLKYPSRFSGDSREVILEGEAYFDIRPMQGTRDTRAPAEIGARASSETIAGARVSRVPFKVQTSGQTVEVLGTQFNISAYTDEAETKTTLVEGKVKVTPGTSTGSPHAGLTTNDYRLTNNVLTPGQQAIIRGHTIKTKEVDLFDHTAWKDGWIVLRNSDIENVVRQLERWYDVSFEVTDWPEGLTLEGEIQRDAEFSNVLEALRLNTGKQLYVTGRRVMEKH